MRLHIPQPVAPPRYSAARPSPGAPVTAGNLAGRERRSQPGAGHSDGRAGKQHQRHAVQVGRLEASGAVR
jgi:hypothetical protein